MSGSAIDDVARKYFYSKGDHDRRLSHRMATELFRYRQIEKAAQEFVDYRGDDLGKIGELKKNLRRALKIEEDPTN